MSYIIHIKHVTPKGELRETGNKTNSSLSDCKSYIKIKHQTLLQNHSEVETEFSVYNKYICASGKYENGNLKFLKSEPN